VGVVTRTSERHQLVGAAPIFFRVARGNGTALSWSERGESTA
jgi:hypothetical protein